MQDDAGKDNLTSIQVTKRTKAIADRASARFGTPRTGLVTRLLEWFEAQPDDVKQEFIDASGDPAGALVRLRMAEMSGAADAEAAGELSIEQATRMIRLMLDRIEQINRQKDRELEEHRPARSSGKKG